MTLLEEISSRRELDEIVDRRIRATTRLAHDHNKFMHELFKKADVNPHLDINGQKDLLRAAKKGVRTNGTVLSECYADYVEKIPSVEVWSSGSSGRVKKVLRSSDEITRIVAGQLRVYQACGMQAGHRILTFPGIPPYGSNQSTPDGLKNINVRSLHFSIPAFLQYLPIKEKGKFAKKLLEMISEFDPDFVRSGTWQMSWLPKFLLPHGFDKSKLRIKAVIFGGDPSTLEERKKIGENWNAEPFEMYSTTEVSVIGFECSSHSGLHLNELGVFVTAVDPETGEETAVGERGVDMVTPLYEANAMPATLLVNYSHGDHITMLSDKCNCNQQFALASHPTRDTRKTPISAFDFEPARRHSLLERALKKMRNVLKPSNK